MTNVITKPKGFYDNFERRPGNDKKNTHYCPGCGHGRVHKLIAEALEKLDIIDQSIFISPVGCTVFAYYYFNCGNIQSAHGRAPAVGTGLRRSNPDSIIISYQGDGDLGAIGTSEIIHAANRGENMTVIFVNNTIYGMTGGQMAPTTLEGQITATTPYGRDHNDQGYAMRMAEIIATLEAPVYVERVAVSDAKNIMKAKRAIYKALEAQKEKKGFTFVEILSACPIGWKMKPVDAVKRIKTELEPYFPVKCFKDKIGETKPKANPKSLVENEEIYNVLGMNDKQLDFKPSDKFINDFPEQKLRIAGFGGQGVLMAGTTLGYLSMGYKLNATWLPSYGPEMRGGTANCHVVLSSKTVGTPVVEKPNVLIAMNTPSFDSFEADLVPGGLAIVNSSLVERKAKRTDINTIYVPVTEIAKSLGIQAAQNMAAVSAYLTYTGVMNIEDLITLIKTNFKKKNLIDKNIEVIRKAHEYVKENCM
ncbi:MAG: 2-oxoacid:acceptor oxidoreductase family protein [Bacteriovoracaceae bacterium]|nr:2-oxoacid:acceptor oxidoreductase family protein [Bacteriovoracaceae bacterium]